jgi:hypothetical protein
VVLDAFDESGTKAGAIVETPQVVAKNVALAPSEHQERNHVGVQIDIRHRGVPDAVQLVQVRQFVIGRHLDVERVPRLERQSVVFDPPVQNRIERPHHHIDVDNSTVQKVQHLPTPQRVLDQSHLVQIFRAELLAVESCQKPLDQSHVAHEEVHLDCCQQVGDCDEDRRGESFQIGVDVEHVDDLGQVVAPEDYNCCRTGVEGVEVGLVEFEAFGPEAHNPEDLEVYVDGGRPVEAFHNEASNLLGEDTITLRRKLLSFL